LLTEPFFLIEEENAGDFRASLPDAPASCRFPDCSKSVLELRDNRPYPAPDLLYIPGIARDHMAVRVHRGLAGRTPDIEPDVVSGWPEILFDYEFAVVGKREDGFSFLICQEKKIRFVPERDNQDMAFAYRMPVPAGIAEIVFNNDILCIGIAERAFSWFHPLILRMLC
jgi:hypothetical protein